MNEKLIESIASYALNQHHPQVLKDALEIIRFIAKSPPSYEIMQYVIDGNKEIKLEQFLIDTVISLQVK